jgi:hypothetical protein
MSTADPLLAALLKERFAYPVWFATAGYEDQSAGEALSEIQAKRQQREQDLLHGDGLTGLLPDQEDEVA